MNKKDRKIDINNKPLFSWLKVATPSILEVPIRTTTTFLVAATTTRTFLGSAEKDKARDWRGRMRETPWNDE